MAHSLLYTLLVLLFTLAAPSEATRRERPVKVGMEAIPCDCDSNGSFSSSEYEIAYRAAIAHGADMLSLSKDWRDIEPSAGVYALSDITRLLAEASTGRVSAQLTLVVLSFDGTSKVPTYLAGVALDHASVTSAFNNLLDAIYALSGSERVKILLLGNEVEAYLTANPTHVSTFASLLTSAKNHARGKANWSLVHVSASFKYSTASSYTTTYAAIQTADTIAAFTYYPINATCPVDCSVLYTNIDTIAASMFTDINNIYTATGGAPMLLSEVGYPSAVSLNSSEALQGAFVASMNGIAQSVGESLMYSIGIHWWTDWPTWLLDFFGYTGVLRAYVGSLGYNNSNGTHKTSWTTLGSFWNTDRPTRVRLPDAGVW